MGCRFCRRAELGASVVASWRRSCLPTGVRDSGGPLWDRESAGSLLGGGPAEGSVVHCAAYVTRCRRLSSSPTCCNCIAKWPTSPTMACMATWPTGPKILGTASVPAQHRPAALGRLIGEVDQQAPAPESGGITPAPVS